MNGYASGAFARRTERTSGGTFGQCLAAALPTLHAVDRSVFRGTASGSIPDTGCEVERVILSGVLKRF